jgi:hypothetical protein
VITLDVDPRFTYAREYALEFLGSRQYDLEAAQPDRPGDRRRGTHPVGGDLRTSSLDVIAQLGRPLAVAPPAAIGTTA